MFQAEREAAAYVVAVVDDRTGAKLLKLHIVFIQKIAGLEAEFGFAAHIAHPGFAEGEIERETGLHHKIGEAGSAAGRDAVAVSMGGVALVAYGTGDEGKAAIGIPLYWATRLEHGQIIVQS